MLSDEFVNKEDAASVLGAFPINSNVLDSFLMPNDFVCYVFVNYFANLLVLLFTSTYFRFPAHT